MNEEWCEQFDNEDICDLSEEEIEALHNLQLASERIDRGYGNLLDAHHKIGGAMDRWETAADKFREAGREDVADELELVLPTGAVGDEWTYKLVEEVKDGFVDPLEETHDNIRDDLVDGQRHINERRQHHRQREQANRLTDNS